LRAHPAHPLRAALPGLDAVLTYGGGEPVVSAYRALGARFCAPITNALDPDTHHPVPADGRFAADLGFLGNRLPDREARVDEFFFRPASATPTRRFLLGGAGWDDKGRSENVRYVGHVGTADHNAFNAGPMAVLNISRDGMAAMGFSPATRVFEAAGAGACILTDAWPGIDSFFAPGEEILVARDGSDVAAILDGLDAARAREIGAAALARVLRDHTYAERARVADAIFRDRLTAKRERGA
ncbi:MAG: glycosyltransferase, partial [Gluconacetobacter diazotrophicus]|nr:glycosyltransferase [Gluconacetobacter diazotrophicus]